VYGKNSVHEESYYIKILAMYMEWNQLNSSLLLQILRRNKNEYKYGEQFPIFLEPFCHPKSLFLSTLRLNLSCLSFDPDSLVKIFSSIKKYLILLYTLLIFNAIF